MLAVLRLFFDPRGAPVKEIHFQATRSGPSYVTAPGPRSTRRSNQFLGSEGTPGPARRDARSRSRRRARAAAGRRRKATPAAPQAAHQNGGCRRPLVRPATASSSPRDQGPKVKVPIFYPTARDRQRLRAEAARLQDQRQGRPAPPTRRAGGLQVGLLAAHARATTTASGTRWKDPPILDNPTETQTIGGATTSSSTTATACGWSPGRPTGLILGLEHAHRDALERGRCCKIAEALPRSSPGT